MMRSATAKRPSSFDFAQDERLSQAPFQTALMLSEVEARVRFRKESN
ncbi:hypothetical protein [Henriciella litoralis]|nr:hypothetical protein [Henriciella litoralis]